MTTRFVAIDPDDVDQVRDLVERWRGPGAPNFWVEAMQTALRSMLPPIKPDEPAGIGAVVRSGSRTWVRVDSAPDAWQTVVKRNWYRWDTWADIPDDVEVRSLGVEP